MPGRASRATFRSTCVREGGSSDGGRFGGGWIERQEFVIHLFQHTLWLAALSAADLMWIAHVYGNAGSIENRLKCVRANVATCKCKVMRRGRRQSGWHAWRLPFVHCPLYRGRGGCHFGAGEGSKVDLRHTCDACVVMVDDGVGNRSWWSVQSTEESIISVRLGASKHNSLNSL